MSRLRPKVVLWWGIGLLVADAVLNFAVPAIFAGFADPSGGNGVDQALYGLFATVLSAVNRVAPFLGAALIGASVVMFYIAKNVVPPAPLTGTDDAGVAALDEQDVAS
jgi:hypothetical protein